MKVRNILLVGLAFLNLSFSACQPQIPENISVAENPPSTSIRSVEGSSGSYITILPREISLTKSPRESEGRFRLLVVVADDQGNSGGMFCPGTNTIPIHNGDTITPCQTAISFPASLPQNRIYVLFIGVNEKSQSEFVNIGAGALSGLLAKGITKAIGLGATTTGPAGFVAGLAIETIVGYAGGKAAEWAQQNEILGSQTYVLERSQNWYDGQELESDSEKSGMHFSFTIEVTNSATGEIVKSENQIPSQPTSIPQAAPAAIESSPQRSDPKEALYAYYGSLNNGDYRRAWNMLSNHFIEKNNPGGYGPYEEWFKTVRETRIDQVNVENQTENSVSYQVQLSYTYQNGQIDTCDILQVAMLYDESKAAWQLDDWSLIDGSC